MKVTLYSTAVCPNCAVLRKKMDAKGIEYEDKQNVEELQALGINRVPVLKVDDELLDFGKANKWINEQ